MPKMQFKSNAKPSLYAYPEPLKPPKKEEKEKVWSVGQWFFWREAIFLTGIISWSQRKIRKKGLSEQLGFKLISEFSASFWDAMVIKELPCCSNRTYFRLGGSNRAFSTKLSEQKCMKRGYSEFGSSRKGNWNFHLPGRIKLRGVDH